MKNSTISFIIIGLTSIIFLSCNKETSIVDEQTGTLLLGNLSLPISSETSKIVACKEGGIRYVILKYITSEGETKNTGFTVDVGSNGAVYNEDDFGPLLPVGIHTMISITAVDDFGELMYSMPDKNDDPELVPLFEITTPFDFEIKSNEFTYVNGILTCIDEKGRYQRGELELQYPGSLFINELGTLYVSINDANSGCAPSFKVLIGDKEITPWIGGDNANRNYLYDILLPKGSRDVTVVLSYPFDRGDGQPYRRNIEIDVFEPSDTFNEDEVIKPPMICGPGGIPD